MEFKNFGALLCMSSGGCLSLDALKRYVLALSKMGYNLLELVLDDTLKIESEPYYGYLIGGYTVKEMRELDDYAYSLGVKIIPSIQTLAHLDRLVKIPHYSNIVDIVNIILADNEDSYKLIDKMFQSLKEAFRSKLVSIGFDEAFYVGRGNYLNIHGYVDKYEILFRHLNKVVEIAKKHGLDCMMWHDLFFSFKYGNGNVSVDNAEIEDEIKKRVPEGVVLNYWEYYKDDTKIYDSMFKCLKTFNREIWHTNSVFTYRGFAPHFNKSLVANKAALKSCKKNNIQNYIVSMWGDNNNDCSYFSAIAALYTIRQYSLGNFSKKSIAEGFYKIFKVSYKNFMSLQLPNASKSNPNITKTHSHTKVSLYNDPLLGIRDKMYKEEGKIDYLKIARKFDRAAKTMGEYSYLFEKLSALCKVLDIKYDLGIKLREAYQNNDKNELLNLANKIKKCIKLVKKFRIAFKKEWYIEYKPHGWDIHEYRLGGLISRLNGTYEVIMDYLNGKLAKIEELEETLLDFGNYFSDFNDFWATISIRGI